MSINSSSEHKEDRRRNGEYPLRHIMEVPLRWREQTDTGSKDLVVMTTADLPNPSYEFGHLLQSTGPCLEAFIHNVNSLSHKNMSLVFYLITLHQILRLFSDGVMRRLCTVNRKLIWRISLWSISRPCIRIRLRAQEKAWQSFSQDNRM
jgi:hypothetical protein